MEQYYIQLDEGTIPTTLGISLVTVLPEKIKSPLLTAEWENQLLLIAQGKMDAGAFIASIAQYTSDFVQENKTGREDMKGIFPESPRTGNQNKDRESIGVCPRCGGPVYEGKSNYYCGNGDHCKQKGDGFAFVMWKNDRFFADKKMEFTVRIAKALLKNGRTDVKGLYSSKKDATYDATVVLDDTGGKYVNYKLAFADKKKA